MLICLRHALRAVTVLMLAGVAASAADLFPHKDRQPTPEELASLPAVVPEKAAQLIKDVQAPEGFDATIFATPPAVNYPVFVAAAPDGTLYVSSDGNGSIDRKPHRGRVLRVRDTNGDGRANEVKAFVPDVDSPRGLVWDDDRLYLLHPPDISVYLDRDGDGLADETRTLVKGIGWGFKDRPADHGSNGLELGVDGWLYAAIGDFGFMEAIGADGRKLRLRGGGVVRVRPDGSGIELFADGTRNIVEAAVGPLLDVLARDNTNDGGGWDVRLHHFTGITQHGYPRLFKNFSDEIIQPLADYGGGSGCGAAWIDEPGIPAEWNNAPFTADWGTEWIYHHGLTTKGATFTATQERFGRLPRVTDLDVDANSSIYAASWKGASFTWVGPEVGFLVKLTPKGYQPEPLPDFGKLGDLELVQQLESPSHRRRLAAQRVLLRRPAPDSSTAKSATALVKLAGDAGKPITTRVAALFTVKQWLGSRATGRIAKLASDSTLGAWAIRALTDHDGQLAGVPTAPILKALKSPDARTRREAAVALARLGHSDGAPAITPLLADSDPVVAHTAVQSLIRLRAGDTCLAVVDDSSAPGALRRGALRVLQSMPESHVVDALITRLARESNGERRAGLLTALCRLYFVDGVWKGDSWGTRPDTRGPFYQPDPWVETPKIAAALKAALERADGPEAAHLAREMARHRIQSSDAIGQVITRARSDKSLIEPLAAQLAEADEIPATAFTLLAEAALDDTTSDAALAQAVIALAKTSDENAWNAILRALPRVQQSRTENNLAERARRAVLNSKSLDAMTKVLEANADELDGQRSLLADAALLKVAGRKAGSPETRATAAKLLDGGWASPRRRVQIMQAAAETGDTSRAAQFVAALSDPDPAVARAASESVKRLKIDPVKFQAQATAAKVGDLAIAEVLDQVMGLPGESGRGEHIFAQVGCNACHTVRADEPLKGPFLGNVATIYERGELAEAILAPNKTIAQGFVANHFEMKDGTEADGFVVQEAADVVTIRNIAAQELKLPVKEIVRREKQERSLMPEGLAAGLTVPELASLLAYLEGLAPAK
jgi:putative membrane-bound dehydrogenase-like protein